MLFQLKLLDKERYEFLAMARKARNQLSHEGKHPNEDDATAALFSVRNLLEILLPDMEIPFVDMDLNDHAMSSPFQTSKTRFSTPKYWIEIKKLPGEAELEKLEAEAREKGHGPAGTRT